MQAEANNIYQTFLQPHAASTIFQDQNVIRILTEKIKIRKRMHPCFGVSDDRTVCKELCIHVNF